VLPFIGLVAAILYRSEKDEPLRRCPSCNNVVKLYVQVCPAGHRPLSPGPVGGPAAAGKEGWISYLSQVRTIALAKPIP